MERRPSSVGGAQHYYDPEVDMIVITMMCSVDILSILEYSSPIEDLNLWAVLSISMS